MIDMTCHISTCTKDATHAVDGNPDNGYTVSRPLNTCWAQYCEGHAEDVALAFTAVYSEAGRNAAFDAIEALQGERAADRPITANRAPQPYDAADEAWAEHFSAAYDQLQAYPASPVAYS